MLWVKTAETFETVGKINGVKILEKIKIFLGKTIYEAEKDVEVLFG